MNTRNVNILPRHSTNEFVGATLDLISASKSKKVILSEGNLSYGVEAKTKFGPVVYEANPIYTADTCNGYTVTTEKNEYVTRYIRNALYNLI